MPFSKHFAFVLAFAIHAISAPTNNTLLPRATDFGQRIGTFAKDCTGDPIGGQAQTFTPHSNSMAGCADVSTWTGEFFGLNWGGRDPFRSVGLFTDSACATDAGFYVLRPESFKHGDSKSLACFSAGQFGGQIKGIQFWKSDVIERGKGKYPRVDGSA